MKKMNKKKRGVPFFVLEPLTPRPLEPFINYADGQKFWDAQKSGLLLQV
jgi:hypothetical protein